MTLDLPGTCMHIPQDLYSVIQAQKKYLDFEQQGTSTRRNFPALSLSPQSLRSLSRPNRRYERTFCFDIGLDRSIRLYARFGFGNGRNHSVRFDSCFGYGY